MATEPKIIGFGRTATEQNLLDEYLLSIISLEEYKRRLADLRSKHE